MTAGARSCVPASSILWPFIEQGPVETDEGKIAELILKTRIISGAGRIYCCLFPGVLERLSEKPDQELLDGTQAISANFPLPG